MSRRLDFVLRANADFIDEQHRKWLADPGSVSEDWGTFFARWIWPPARNAFPGLSGTIGRRGAASCTPTASSGT